MFSGWWKKKNRTPSPEKTPSPKKYSKTKSRSKVSKLASESSLAATEFSEAPSGFSHRETKRSNPLYRSSIGDDPRNSDNAMSDDDEVIEGFGRRNSVKSAVSSYSGFGIDAEAETSNFAEKANLTAADKAAGYIGVVEAGNSTEEASPAPMTQKNPKDTKSSPKKENNSSPNKSKSKKKKIENQSKSQKKKTDAKNSVEKNEGADSSSTKSTADSGTENSKPARDLDAAKAKRDADKAARLAKIRAAREKKKENENKMLEEALAMIDNLPDE